MAFSCEGSWAEQKDITVQRLGLERKARAQYAPARESRADAEGRLRIGCRMQRYPGFFSVGSSGWIRHSHLPRNGKVPGVSDARRPAESAALRIVPTGSAKLVKRSGWSSTTAVEFEISENLCASGLPRDRRNGAVGQLARTSFQLVCPSERNVVFGFLKTGEDLLSDASSVTTRQTEDMREEHFVGHGAMIAPSGCAVFDRCEHVRLTRLALSCEGSGGEERYHDAEAWARECASARDTRAVAEGMNGTERQPSTASTPG
jgi:hypothetical protein